MIDKNKVREYLRKFDFQKLFIEELGWDRPGPKIPDAEIDGRSYNLDPIAQKRGVQVFLCATDASGHLPDYTTRKQIESKVRKYAYEHLIIFTDAAKTVQKWQWVAREPGKPAQVREHEFRSHQSGESIIQKLDEIAFALSDEEALTLLDVTVRLKDAFDRAKVTKRFYDQFSKERDSFAKSLKFLNDIPTDHMHDWYVSVMLNRLMFIYFVQKKGFLNDNPNYLKDKLAECSSKGDNKYYKQFLCPLFFEGFAKKKNERSATMNKLLGDVPYLNGGLFMKHQIEELHGKDIDIGDKAFEKVFDFFEQYQWHLDDSPLKDGKEINPEVLGYIFEKYINQKQMGAYYTKEDITGYITKNTVIPYLFDAARKECKIAFEGEHSVWRYLREDPDRFIYAAVKKGVDKSLPPEVEAGIADVSKRGGWNKPADEELALPTEIWREVVARRQRYQDVRAKLATGELQSINDLITYNLDIRQFAQDVIENCEGPELLRAFWKAISKITVLDPTCGSGAFLFAALNILEPLYEACLDRMQNFVVDLERSGQKHSPKKFGDFSETLERINHHANRSYFIYKSIIVNNLYGVDIMEEAVEICKLRLFLKLVAQVDDKNKIEPLPDIDFNIRPGNTLIGFANYEDAKQRIASKLDFENMMERIDLQARDLGELLKEFRRQQAEDSKMITSEHKRDLRNRLDLLNKDLNGYLSEEYGIDSTKSNVYNKWLDSHRPFHWYTEFYNIMNEGEGFDIIIGNPPYLETREVDYKIRGFRTTESSAVHAMCVERALQLLSKQGTISMIVPMSIVSTQRMKTLQVLLEVGHTTWYSNFSWRPGKLFDTVNRALTIFVAVKNARQSVYSTTYQKWSSETRDLLMERISFATVPEKRNAFWVPKIGSEIEFRILQKLQGISQTIGSNTGKTGHRIYYRTTGGLYWKVFTSFAPGFQVNGKKGHSTRETWFSVKANEVVYPLIAALSSDLFWWWYTITSNGRDLNPYDVQNFPLPDSCVSSKEMIHAGSKYEDSLKANSQMLTRNQKQTGITKTQSFKIQKCKPEIELIDELMAPYYDLSADELDFLKNFEVKYRMGQSLDDDEE